MNTINISNYLIKLMVTIALVFSHSLSASLLPDDNKLYDFSGTAVSFTSYIQAPQWTVVMLWASDCHICNVEAQQFVKLHAQYSNKNIRVLGISVDGKARQSAAEEFIQVHQLNFPNLISEPEAMISMYRGITGENWLGTPSYMIFSPAGKISAYRSGMLPPDLIISFIKQQTQK